jgi:hypothetical protein
MIVSFKSHRVSTTANTTITPVNIVGARLVSTTTADVIVHLHDAGSAATSAATRIGTLFATNPGVDEIGYPMRVGGGTLIVTPTGTSAQVYIFVR